MKKILILITLLTGLFINPINIKAASASISVSSSASTVIVGNNVTFTVTVSSSSALGAWNFDLKYDSSKLKFINSSFGGTYVADVFKNTNQKSATYTFTFSAIASGTPSVYVSNSAVVGYDEKEMTVSNGSRKITVMTRQQLEATYSSNNNLKSLSIDGISLTPEFNKDTLEYDVELEPNTEKIKINAQVEDSKSSLTGTGEVVVTEGVNKINIVVTAQNGNKKTYVINAVVKELDPINITINDQEFTLIRQKDILTMPSTYKETIIKIQNEDIPAFTSEITNFTLVGLKDSEGNVDLYIYNSSDETYKKYNEVTFNRIILLPLSIEDKNIPKGYLKTTTKINDIEVEGYQYKKGSEFTVIYGLNIETGVEELYLYDEKEKTIQRFNSNEIIEFTEKNTNYFYVIIAVSGLSLVLLIVLIVVSVNFNKNIKKLKKISFNDNNIL